MNVLFPLLASVLQAVSFTLDKTVLNLRRVDWRAYLSVSFPLIAVLVLIAFIVIRPPLPLSSFTLTLVGLLAFLVFEHIVSNTLYYRALQSDHLSELRLWGLAIKIPVILGVVILFSDERHWSTVILALCAAGAVVWSHWDHARLRIRRSTAPYIIWSLCIAPLAVGAVKVALRTLNPVTLELLRIVPVAIIMYSLFYHRSRRGFGGTSWTILIATNVLTTTAGLLLFFGYRSLGVIATGLLYTLEPSLVYLFSLVILREPFIPKRIASFFIVLACIALARVLQ